MRPIFGWPIALFFAAIAVGAFFNGSAINEWVENNSIQVSNDEVGKLVGAQENEKWFVVLIDFPDQNEFANCDQDRAATLIDQSALNYLRQGVYPNGTLEIKYHDRIVQTKLNMEDYGHDENGENDVGKNGVNPHILAEDIVNEILDEVEWEDYDLNDDGWVDRFLILHCAKPQEDGSGSSSRIWSHFSSIDNVVTISENLQIAYYTIASQYNSNNFGTIIHEMYHQFGAADLYPVHEPTVTQTWKGIGKWDIMASGNWNGNGAWPALPTTVTSELMGVERYDFVDLEWLPGTSCNGPVVTLTGIGEGGNSLKIPIGENEFVWIEYRSDYGFDSRLPGNGILVMQQDLNAGSVDDNTVNSHPERPWLVVVEADGNQDMVAGINEGEQSDLFWDGDKFGYDGIQIRNRDGILVDWIAEVSVNGTNVTVSFSSDDCGHLSNFDFPDYTSILTPASSIPFEGECDGQEFILSSSDGRDIDVIDNQINFQTDGTIGVIGLITGTISCSTGTSVDIRHEFEILGNIPIESTFTGQIPFNSNTIVKIPIDTIGGGQQTWIIGIEGALSRIASTSQTQTIGPKSYIEISIEHKDLLTNGMLIKGELVLATESGQKYAISIELTAKNAHSSAIESFTEPAILVPIAFLLISIWVVLGIESSTGEVSSELDESPFTVIEGDDPAFVDPFGEPYG